jgi:cyanophycinase-like exopeptidase
MRMKQLIHLVIPMLLLPMLGVGQSYTRYFTGNSNNVSPQPRGGVCLMGGGTEDDAAMRWFLQGANGGDVLVLRASGSDGYNDYFYSELGVPVNSVETIVCHSAAASNNAYVLQTIKQAEAIWFAGGDQWDYISYWRGTPVDSLINEAITQRRVVVGGTSAGMAISSGYYFTARHGTVTSDIALQNPYNQAVTVDSMAFLQVPFTQLIVTDQHYTNRDRHGRHMVFLARALKDYGVAARGIACDESTAVCIDTLGIARVYGSLNSHNAFFLQPNCELSDMQPEQCSAGFPLTWNRGQAALKVFSARGTVSGQNFLDLKDWKTASGGTWSHWSVESGVLNKTPGTPPNCSTISVLESESNALFQLFPNPSGNVVALACLDESVKVQTITIADSVGAVHLRPEVLVGCNPCSLDVRNLASGMYFVTVELKRGTEALERVTLSLRKI